MSLSIYTISPADGSFVACEKDRALDCFDVRQVILICKICIERRLNRVATGQGKVREFCNWSGKFGILRKVREFWNWSGKFDFLMSYAQ